MKFKADSISDMALNAIELRAIEYINQNDIGSAIVLLEDQLERDPSRAGIAKAIATAARLPMLSSSFSIMKLLHEKGDPDPFKNSLTKEQLQLRDKIKTENYKPQSSPKYTSTDEATVSETKKDQ